MKLISQHFEKDKSGSTTIVPEDKEDLWQLYNLLQKGDEIKISTHRNVKKVSSVGGGGKDKGKSERKVMTLHMTVEDVDYIPSDEVMRIRGKTTEAHEFVPLHSYHTAEVQLNKPLTLYKDDWDDIAYGIIVKACSIEDKAEVGAVVMEEGVAHLCLITDNMTVLRNKIEKSIPRKRRGEGGGGAHDKALQKFFQMVLSTLLRNFDLIKLKAIILASPGFTADSLYKFILADATKENNKTVFQNKSKFIVVHSSTGYLQGLEEVLKDPSIQRKLSNTKFAREAAIFEQFQSVLNEDDDRAWYGPEECERAVNLGAVKYLMITDTLFKSDDIVVRKHYIALTEKVRGQGGEALIFSSLHESGEQLNQLTGIAVLLKYPVPDLDEEED
ncbi:uncharacterized protein PRCAT00003113001 [Priceomyces carsonii]|uniref:uncharacterized protein n=1 Tax=Priceomyces carsonii TaxID=28549 RepID=UPI002EDBA046|nr:unnamed protein product [Priceomyces carsonii]